MHKLLLCLLTAFTLAASAQQTKPVYKSVYQVNGADLSFSVPDTLAKQLGIREEVKLPVGTIQYFNTYLDGFSQLQVAFAANAGFSGINAPEYIVYTNANAKTYSIYKEGEFIRCVNYELPTLTPAGDSVMVNGYMAKPFRYSGKDSLTAIIWLSKALPAEVNPGLAFDGYGGVAKIIYSLNGQSWSLDLTSIGKMDDSAVKDSANRKPASAMKVPHFLLHRDDE